MQVNISVFFILLDHIFKLEEKYPEDYATNFKPFLSVWLDKVKPNFAHDYRIETKGDNNTVVGELYPNRSPAEVRFVCEKEKGKWVINYAVINPFVDGYDARTWDWKVWQRIDLGLKERHFVAEAAKHLSRVGEED